MTQNSYRGIKILLHKVSKNYFIIADMAQLVAIVYDKVDTAQDVFAKILDLQKQYLIDLEDMAYVTKDQTGKLKVNQGENLAAAGAVGGAFWGMLVGMLFFAPFLGAAVGAAAGGAAGAMSDYGIDDKFIKDLTSSMTNNSSALFVLFHKANPDKVVPEISKFGGKVLRTSMSTENEKRLQEALTHGAPSL